MENVLKLARVLILCTLMVVPAIAVASSPNPTAQAGGEGGLDPISITASAKLMVRRVESGSARLYLYDPRSEETHVVVVPEKVELTARRKKDFGGRRKLEFGDLATGQTLKVTYRTDDGRITSIQVLEKAS